MTPPTDLAASEREKYRRMWAEPSYHIGSPGERAVPLCLASLPMRPGQTVVDAGAGSGRGAVLLEKAGLSVTLLDFCHTAVEPPASHLPYIDAVLWDLPPMTFDWVYCVDVLEHIPPVHVEAVLNGLARIATLGMYLQICCVDDNCGRVIGETLHLTVHPPAWWKPLVEARWPILADLSQSCYAIYATGPAYERSVRDEEATRVSDAGSDAGGAAESRERPGRA